MTSLKQASSIRVGTKFAQAVYVGADKAWPPFKPTDVGTPAIWLDASTLNLANGAAVSTWTNLGYGSQPTITAGATFRTNALNTIMPVVRITQGSGKLRWYSGTAVDKDWTLVYYARKWRVSGAGRVVAAFGTSANILVGYHGNEMDQCYVEGWLTSGVAPLHSTQWKLYSADSTSVTAARFFVDGVQRAMGGPTPAKGWGGTFCISGYLDNADVAVSQEADCEIAELMLWPFKMSDASRALVENYLRIKWGVQPPFTPTDLGPNLVAWFDASDAASVQVTGSGVNNWVNKGVGAMTLTQATDAYRPAYASNAVNFASGKGMAAANAPASYDVVLVSTPNTPAEWRTLLRSATGHEVIIEAGNIRLGTYHTTGFLPAVVGIVSPANMTSNAAPAPFVASAISEYPGGYEAFKAFDTNAATIWHSANPITTEGAAWVKIDLGAPKSVSSYRVQARSPTTGQILEELGSRRIE